ncbi:MAG: RAD55 family ATPase [Candidatus Heimdallarchaeota archaeon]
MIAKRVWFDIQGLENIIQEPIPRGYNILIAGVDGSGRTGLAIALLKARLERDVAAFVTIDESPESIKVMFEEQFNIPVESLIEADRLTIIDSWSGQGRIEDWVVIDPNAPDVLDYITDLWIKTHRTKGEGYLMVIDSLSTLFEYAKFEEALQFLRHKTRKIRASEGIGIFTISETAHSAEFLTTIIGFFDGVFTTGLTLEAGTYIHTVKVTKMRRVSTTGELRTVKLSTDGIIIE